MHDGFVVNVMYVTAIDAATLIGYT